MTRRGSVVYYLAAVAIGCFFTAVAIAVRFAAVNRGPSMQGRSFLFLYFTSLFFGACPALLAAFILRRFTATNRGAGPWHWVVSGTVVSWGLVWTLGRVGMFLGQRPSPGLWLLPSLLVWGPAFVMEEGIWLVVPVGAATGFVLYRIHRAFEPRAGAAPE